MFSFPPSIRRPVHSQAYSGCSFSQCASSILQCFFVKCNRRSVGSDRELFAFYLAEIHWAAAVNIFVDVTDWPIACFQTSDKLVINNSKIHNGRFSISGLKAVITNCYASMASGAWDLLKRGCNHALVPPGLAALQAALQKAMEEMGCFTGILSPMQLEVINVITTQDKTGPNWENHSGQEIKCDM